MLSRPVTLDLASSQACSHSTAESLGGLSKLPHNPRFEVHLALRPSRQEDSFEFSEMLERNLQENLGNNSDSNRPTHLDNLAIQTELHGGIRTLLQSEGEKLLPSTQEPRTK